MLIRAITLLCVIFGVAIFGCDSSSSSSNSKAPDPVQVVFKTSKGEFTLELRRDKAPKTVENFVQYVRDGYYEGIIFHRIMADFMIQSGGFTDQRSAARNQAKPGQRPEIVNESDNGLSNVEYTIAMARTMDPDSASSQFFINTKNNSSTLDRQYSRDKVGYCVFGKVIQGKDVIDAIKSVTVTRDPMSGEISVPRETITIEKAWVVETESPSAK